MLFRSGKFQIVNLPDTSVKKLAAALKDIGHAAGTLSADGGPISGTSCSTTKAQVIGVESLTGDFTCADSD